MKKVRLFMLGILIIGALVGCGALTASNNDPSFIDPLDCLNDSAIWEYTERDLLSIGAQKSADSDDEAYKKDVTFCENPGEAIFNLGGDGKLGYFSYRTTFEGSAFTDKVFVDRFNAAYSILENKYKTIHDVYGEKSEIGTGKGTIECTIDTFKNDMQKTPIEDAHYEFTFAVEYDNTADVFPYKKWINLSIITSWVPEENAGFAIVNMVYFG